MQRSVLSGGLVQAGELLEMADSVRILDASWNLPNNPVTGRQEFDAVHAKNARFFDIDGIARACSLPHMLPAAATFRAHLLRLACADPDQPVVVYDRMGSLFSAPRVWWTFRAFGHHNVAVLDGGLAAWIDAGGPVEASATPTEVLTPSDDQPSDAAAHLVASIDEVRAIVAAGPSSSSPLIVDARSPDRFYARQPEPRAGITGGHMPGAINIPFGRFAVGDQAGPHARWKSVEDIRRVFREASPPGRDLLSEQVVASCGSGLTACVVAFAAHLAQAAKPVRVYDGSWTEWGADPVRNPIVIND